MAVVNTLAVRFQFLTQEAQRGADQLANKIKGLGSRFQAFAQNNRTIGDVINNVKNRVLALNPALAALATAVVAVGAALNKAVRQFADYADNLSKLSTRIGVSVETLSQMAFAAELSGSNLQKAIPAFRTLARVVDEAKTGNTLYAEALERVGVTAANINTPIEDLFLIVADGIAAIEDAGTRLAVAQEVLGRGGTELLPLLVEGAAGIEAMKREADELGLTITQETGLAAAHFNDTLSRLNATFNGVKRALATALLPTFQQGADTMLDFAKVISRFLVDAVITAQIAFAKLAAAQNLVIVGAQRVVAFFKRDQAAAASLDAELRFLVDQLTMTRAEFLENRFAAAQAKESYDDLEESAAKLTGTIKELEGVVEPMAGRRVGARLTREQVLAAIEEQRRRAQILQGPAGVEEEVPGLIFDRDLVGEATILAKDYFDNVVNLGQVAFTTLDQFSSRFTDGLISAATGARVKFGEFFKDLLANLARAIVRALILRTVLGAFGGGLSHVLGNLGLGPQNLGFPGPGAGTLGEAARARSLSSSMFSTPAPATATAGISRPRVVVHEASPATWVEITDEYVHPRFRQRRDDLNEEPV